MRPPFDVAPGPFPCYSSRMSEAKPEPTPFEKLRLIARQILSVPKKEIDRREAEWKRQRSEKKPQK